MRFFNTLPLVWGMLKGPQQGLFDLSFEVPSRCADALATGAADIGIVPAVELLRLDVDVLPGVGIAAEGAVRSILLVSKNPYGEIRTLATDSSSRTSVQLARIILQEQYGCRPELVSLPPDLPTMLERADAALVIGDPALLLEPELLPYRVLDLAASWTELTGLPMVFAVWAIRRGKERPGLAEAFMASYEFGRSRIDDIVREEAARRGISEALGREYLTRYIRFPIGEREQQGLRRFLDYARQLPNQKKIAEGVHS